MSDILANSEKKDTELEAGGLGIEKILKKYIIPTIEELWAKLKIETKQSLTMSQTLFYTLENWVTNIRESKVYYVTTTSMYYFGGFLFKSTIVDPVHYFFGWFPEASATWIKTVSVKFYTETSEILERFRDYLIYPGIEGVVFLDKSLGSIFYVFGIPVILSYKTVYGIYYLTQDKLNDIGNDVYYYFYSTKPREDPNEDPEEDPEEGPEEDPEEDPEEESEEEEDPEEGPNEDPNEDPEPEKSLAWDLVEIIIPGIISFSVAILGLKLLKVI